MFKYLAAEDGVEPPFAVLMRAIIPIGTAIMENTFPIQPTNYLMDLIGKLR